jgi:tetratricopeptide (TPR) repeat protein
MSSGEHSEHDLWKSILILEGVDKGPVLLELSQLAFEKAQYLRSLTLAESARDVYLEASDELGYAESLVSMAFSLFSLERFNSAISALELAVDSYQKCYNSQEWEYREYLSTWYRSRGDMKEAINQLEICLENYSYEEDGLGIAKLESKLAYLECEGGACVKAMERLVNAKLIYKNKKDPFMVAEIDMAIARCHNHLGDWLTAQTFAISAIAVFDSCNKTNQKRANAYTQLGWAMVGLNEYQRALESLEKAHSLIIGFSPADLQVIHSIQEIKVLALRGLERFAEAELVESMHSLIGETLNASTA